MRGRATFVFAFAFATAFAFVHGLASGPTAAWASNELVVLDPGHGGALVGAHNPDGVPEKAIVLSIAASARRNLEQRGFRVLLTREGDQHVDLKDRIALANRRGAAVFVSIHGNYSPVHSRRGVETYVLSVASSDESALTLAHLENEGEVVDRGGDDDSFGGGGPARTKDDLGFILGDLEQGYAHERSGILALFIQEALGRVDGLGPSRGLRQAPFRVLKGARMPAVLVEVGYLSNARQGAFLATQVAQSAAGEAIARGIKRFFDDG